MGRITPAGVITEFSVASNTSVLNSLTSSAGSLWFTDHGDTKAIGRVTTAGVITEFTGTLDQMHAFPNDITTGPDNNVWFTDDGTPSAIGRVTPDGTLTEFTTGLNSGSAPDTLTAGPDGNVWFADQNAAKRAVGRITRSGTITEFSAGLNQMSVPDDIALGPDGNLWVEQSTPGGVARITPSGQITETTKGLNPGAGADGDQLVTGADGNLWFDDNGTTRAIAQVALQLPPSASTGAASLITNTGARIAGTVTPLGSPATVTIRYGTTSALTSSASARTVPAGTDPIAIGVTLPKLTPGTTYSYEVVAKNPFGTATGKVATFKTIGTAPSTSVTGAFGNQNLTFTTPPSGICLAASSSAKLTFTSAAVRGSRRTRLSFRSAALYVDRGVAHRHRHVVRRRGRRVTVVTVSYTANAVLHHVPGTVSLRLRGLRRGAHRLKIVAAYSEQMVRRHRHITVVVSTALTGSLRVC